MEGLYKGKYLIAIYDNKDNLIDVGFNIRDMRTYVKQKTSYRISQAFRKGLYKYHFIDCTKKHKDVFAEEDKLFLQYVSQNANIPNRAKAKMLGVSMRTYYRHKAKGTLYKLEQKSKVRSDYGESNTASN